MTRRKPVTAKSLGLVAGVKLSPTYANSRDHYKVVTDRVHSYSISGSDRHGYQVTPMLDATIYIKVGKVIHVVHTYEYGEPFVVNNKYGIDPHVRTYAHLAVTALRALERRAAEVKP